MLMSLASPRLSCPVSPEEQQVLITACLCHSAIETQVPDSLHVGAAKKYPGGWPLAHTCIISRCAFLPVGTDLDTLVGMQLFTSLTPRLVVYAPL